MTQFTLFEKILIEFDGALRTLLPPASRPSTRNNPGEHLAENVLTQQERKHAAGLMRVNHSGEVCAQALYRGQALTAKLQNVKDQMEKAAQEEVDHLAWCENRLNELSSSTSLLNPIWYTGSFLIGMVAGKLGDGYSLGFVTETENQVTEHLENHLKILPKQDKKSEAILIKMAEEERNHAQGAMKAGAFQLPKPIQTLMRFTSKIMTKTSYHL